MTGFSVVPSASMNLVITTPEAETVASNAHGHS